MHVFVERRELIEITVALVRKPAAKSPGQRVENFRHIAFHFIQRINRQIPARVMGDGDRIIERITAIKQRRMAVFLA